MQPRAVPSYQLVFPGGDTNIVANLEYRIPIVGIPVTLAPFFDAGMDRISNKSQLKLNPDRISSLDSQFPEAAFGDSAVLAAGTQLIRTSVGLELQVLVPVFNQPFRIYWASTRHASIDICNHRSWPIGAISRMRRLS